jgi:hypothetical protein
MDALYRNLNGHSDKDSGMVEEIVEGDFDAVEIDGRVAEHRFKRHGSLRSSLLSPDCADSKETAYLEVASTTSAAASIMNVDMRTGTPREER